MAGEWYETALDAETLAHAEAKGWKDADAGKVAIAAIKAFDNTTQESVEALKAWAKGFQPIAPASEQAAEALKLLAGVGTSLMGRLQMLDGRHMAWSELRLPRQADCPVCGSGQAH